MENIQKYTAKYNVAGIQQMVRKMIKTHGYDNGSYGAEIIITAWLDSFADLYKAEWKVFVCVDLDIHINIHTKNRGSTTNRTPIIIRNNEKFSRNVHYKEMFITMAETHNHEAYGYRPAVPIKGLTQEQLNHMAPTRIVRAVEIRGKHFSKVRVRGIENAEFGEFRTELEIYEDSKSIKAATAEELQEAVSANVLPNAEIIEALGSGNFRVRSGR